MSTQSYLVCVGSFTSLNLTITRSTGIWGRGVHAQKLQHQKAWQKKVCNVSKDHQNTAAL